MKRIKLITVVVVFTIIVAILYACVTALSAQAEEAVANCVIIENIIDEYETIEMEEEKPAGDNNTDSTDPKEDREVTLTIHYWYNKIGGEPAAESYTNTVKWGTKIKVPSPVIEGWESDVDLVIMEYPNGDVTTNVIYTEVFYKLTIRYRYADGSGRAHEPHVEKLRPNEKYSIKSPKIEGYTVSKKRVKGTMPEWTPDYKVTKTVYYTKIELPEDPVPLNDLTPTFYVEPRVDASNIVFNPVVGWIMYLPD